MGFLDWGRNLVNNLPVVGGLASSIWGDPDQERVQDAYKQSQEQLAKQRAYNMDARTNLMNQGALAFGPRNQMLGQMMGMQGPAMDLSQILKNPMSQQQQDDIRSAAFPTPQTSSRNVEFKQLPGRDSTINYQDPGGNPYGQPQGAPTRGSYASRPFRRY